MSNKLINIPGASGATSWILGFAFPPDDESSAVLGPVLELLLLFDDVPPLPLLVFEFWLAPVASQTYHKVEIWVKNAT